MIRLEEEEVKEEAFQSCAQVKQGFHYYVVFFPEQSRFWRPFPQGYIKVLPGQFDGPEMDCSSWYISDHFLSPV